MDITIIGAAILDVLAQPVDREVFETGSWPVEDLQMHMGGDGANEALVLAGLGKRVQLQTVFVVSAAIDYLVFLRKTFRETQTRVKVLPRLCHNLVPADDDKIRSRLIDDCL